MTPRTPTPFKNAMEKYGPLQLLVRVTLYTLVDIVAVSLFILIFLVFSVLSSQPLTPNLEDDINEVILKDSGIDLIFVRSTPPEQRRKTLVTNTNK